MEPNSYVGNVGQFIWRASQFIFGQPAGVAESGGENHVDRLPMELLPLIFFRLFEARNGEGAKKGDLTVCALVCKKWKRGTEDAGLQKRIAGALDACGEEELQRLLRGRGEVNLGKIPPLPLWMCQHFKREEGILTLVPKTVTIKREDGKLEEIHLNNLRNVGTLAGYAETEHKVGFTQNSYQEALDEAMKHEETHWVWIKKEVIGRRCTYKEQITLAEGLSKKGRAAMSRAIDTAMSLLMEHIRTGQRVVVWDPPVNDQRTFVRVQEKTGDWDIIMGFAPAGLSVSPTSMATFTTASVSSSRGGPWSLDNWSLEDIGIW